MFLKYNFVTTLLTLCCISTFCWTEVTATYCSLDRMKKFAMEACEHLFEFEELEVREKRSIFSGHNINRVISESSKNSHYVRRSIYPAGGYLKVGPAHYHKLSQLDVSPRYKAKKPTHLQHHDKKMRYKREHKDEQNYNNNISYCCYHKCEEDFFC